MALRNLPRRAQLAVFAGLSAVLLAATGVTVWRVLRPSEVVTTATTPYPDVAIAVPGKVGALISAPLIVDDRLRVFAKKREVWSDGPPSYHYERSAYWSYRRWPAEVAGVAKVLAPQPVVVTAWSDGLLVGIDAVTGEVLWRVQGDAVGGEYAGRRTGAATVYEPAGLFTTASGFITSTGTTVRAYRADGSLAWSRALPTTEECRGTEFTTQSQWFLLDTCANMLRRVDAGTGADLGGQPAESIEPVSCLAGHSQCQALRTSGIISRGWLLTSADPIESPPLAAPNSELVDGVVVVVSKLSKVTAHDPKTGREMWSFETPAPIQLLAGGKDRAFVLLMDRTLIALHPHTGTDLTRAGINMVTEPETQYEVASVYVSNRYLVLERTNPSVPKDSSDDAYYFTNRPILITIG